MTFDEKTQDPNAGQSGFTLVEVVVASVISMISLIALANLFTLALYQNKHVKQATTATALAQRKIEELNSLQAADAGLAVGGSLTAAVTGYNDSIYVNDPGGTISTDSTSGGTLTYQRYWLISNDPETLFASTPKIISVRVFAVNPSRGTVPENTVLTTERSF